MYYKQLAPCYFKIKINLENEKLIQSLFFHPVLNFQATEAYFILGDCFYIITSKFINQIINNAVDKFYYIDNRCYEVALSIALELQEPVNFKSNNPYKQVSCFENQYCCDNKK